MVDGSESELGMTVSKEGSFHVISLSRDSSLSRVFSLSSFSLSLSVGNLSRLRGHRLLGWSGNIPSCYTTPLILSYP